MLQEMQSFFPFIFFAQETQLKSCTMEADVSGHLSSAGRFTTLTTGTNAGATLALHHLTYISPSLARTSEPDFFRPELPRTSHLHL